MWFVLLHMPKEKNTLNRLFSVKCKIILIECMDFIFLLISHYWSEYLDFFCKNDVDVLPQEQVKVCVRSDLIFSSSCSSSTGVLHSHYSTEAFSHAVQFSATIIWLLCFPSPNAHAKIGRVSLSYNPVRCIWMTPNVSTLDISLH